MVQAPDVKALLLDHLLAVVGVPVVSKRPDDGTPSFVRVIGTGGSGRRDRILQNVQVTVDCYAPSTGRAFELAALVDAAIHAIPASSVPVSAVLWATTPQEYPDPDTGSPRYTATYQLTVICH